MSRAAIDVGLRSKRAYIGIAWMLAATVFLAVNYAAIRHVSLTLHPFEIAFFRNICGVLVLLPALAHLRFRPLRTERLGGHLARGLMNASSMLTYFYALSIVTLSQATAISFTGPIFAAVIAVLLLRERVTPHKLIAFAACATGVALATDLSGTRSDQGWLLLLASAICYGGVMVTMRSLALTESSITITAYAALTLTPLTLPFAILVWRWPTMDEWLWLGFIGLVATLAQLALSQAFREAEATVVMPFDFARLIWAALMGAAFFGDPIQPHMLIGGVLIFGGCVAIGFSPASNYESEKIARDQA